MRALKDKIVIIRYDKNVPTWTTTQEVRRMRKVDLRNVAIDICKKNLSEKYDLYSYRRDGSIDRCLYSVSGNQLHFAASFEDIVNYKWVIVYDNAYDEED